MSDLFTFFLSVGAINYLFQISIVQFRVANHIRIYSCIPEYKFECRLNTHCAVMSGDLYLLTAIYCRPSDILVIIRRLGDKTQTVHWCWRLRHLHRLPGVLRQVLVCVKRDGQQIDWHNQNRPRSPINCTHFAVYPTSEFSWIVVLLLIHLVKMGKSSQWYTGGYVSVKMNNWTFHSTHESLAIYFETNTIDKFNGCFSACIHKFD